MKLTEEGIFVRKMEENDVSSVVAIDEKITHLHRPNMWKSQVQHYLSRPETINLIAEIEGHVVGFMMATIHPWLFGVEKGGWVEILGVDPA
ncbi:hypothetical protein KAR91_86225, partial [Candidatus Pacearchaeota archaeon]|nr:hypothetical protein [Candidatus Pacearchaeota archaeon]